MWKTKAQLYVSSSTDGPARLFAGSAEHRNHCCGILIRHMVQDPHRQPDKKAMKK
jgi:hypothetical protein